MCFAAKCAQFKPPPECADDRRLCRGVGGSPRHGRTQRLAPDAVSSPGPPESKFQARPRAWAALCCPEHRLRAQIGPCTPAGAAAFSRELPRRSTLHWPVFIASCKSWPHPFHRRGCFSERTALHGGAHGCGTVLGRHGGDLGAHARAENVNVSSMNAFSHYACWNRARDLSPHHSMRCPPPHRLWVDFGSKGRLQQERESCLFVHLCETPTIRYQA